jgi:hypothetical protein
MKPKKWIAWMPGSPVHKWLEENAKRFGAKVSYAFCGITVKSKNVLYRHAQLADIHRTVGDETRTYQRWNWKDPFHEKNKTRIDFILLHADKPREVFFLLPASKNEELVKSFPRRINIAVDPIMDLTPERAMLMKYKMSAKEIKRILHR